MDDAELLRQDKTILVARIRELENDAFVRDQASSSHSTSPSVNALSDDALKIRQSNYNLVLSEYNDTVAKLQRYHAWGEKAMAVLSEAHPDKQTQVSSCPCQAVWPTFPPLDFLVEQELLKLDLIKRQAMMQLTRANDWKNSIERLTSDLRRSRKRASDVTTSARHTNAAQGTAAPLAAESIANKKRRLSPKRGLVLLLDDDSDSGSDADVGTKNASKRVPLEASTPPAKRARSGRQSVSHSPRASQESHSPVMSDHSSSQVRKRSPVDDQKRTEAGSRPNAARNQAAAAIRHPSGPQEVVEPKSKEALEGKGKIKKRPAYEEVHKRQQAPAPPVEPITPPGYWQMGFPPTSETTQRWRAHGQDVPRDGA